MAFIGQKMIGIVSIIAVIIAIINSYVNIALAELNSNATLNPSLNPTPSSSARNVTFIGPSIVNALPVTNEEGGNKNSTFTFLGNNSGR